MNTIIEHPYGGYTCLEMSQRRGLVYGHFNRAPLWRVHMFRDEPAKGFGIWTL